MTHFILSSDSEGGVEQAPEESRKNQATQSQDSYITSDTYSSSFC